MGGFSLWHWIILLVILVIPVGMGLLIWLLVRATRKPAAAPGSTVASTLLPPQHSSAEVRLQELVSLRSKGLITDAEYEQQRSNVLRSV